jgi:hypothetical protein
VLILWEKQREVGGGLGWVGGDGRPALGGCFDCFVTFNAHSSSLVL